MGADNLAQFHLWKDWQAIAALVPIAVATRPGYEEQARAAYLKQVEARSFTYRNTKTRVEPATLGNQAGLFGSAYLPFLLQKLGAGS